MGITFHFETGEALSLQWMGEWRIKEVFGHVREYMK